jgi:hypothetical protein
MKLVYYNSVLNSLFVFESDLKASLIFFHAVNNNLIEHWVCLGEL